MVVCTSLLSLSVDLCLMIFQIIDLLQSAACALTWFYKPIITTVSPFMYLFQFVDNLRFYESHFLCKTNVIQMCVLSMQIQLLTTRYKSN